MYAFAVRFWIELHITVLLLLFRKILYFLVPHRQFRIELFLARAHTHNDSEHVSSEKCKWGKMKTTIAFAKQIKTNHWISNCLTHSMHDLDFFPLFCRSVLVLRSIDPFIYIFPYHLLKIYRTLFWCERVCVETYFQTIFLHTFTECPIEMLQLQQMLFICSH